MGSVRRLLALVVAGWIAAAGCNAVTGADRLGTDLDAAVSPGASASSASSASGSSGEGASSASSASGASSASSASSGGLDAGSDGDASSGGAGPRVFVTSTTTTGAIASAGTGGLAAADKICLDRANAAGLGGTWNAWLSNSLEDAISRVGPGPWSLVTGEIVASKAELVASAPLHHAIDKTELGAVLDRSTTTNVWTGSDGAGIYSAASCGSWKETLGNGTVGNATSSANPAWSHATTAACAGANRLYCFQR